MPSNFTLPIELRFIDNKTQKYAYFSPEQLASLPTPTDLTYAGIWTGAYDKNNKKIYAGDIISKPQTKNHQAKIKQANFFIRKPQGMIGFNFGFGSNPDRKSSWEIIGDVYLNTTNQTNYS